MCRAEIGIHHHIVGASLLRYAPDSSWREDNRRLSNGEQVNRLAALSLKRSKSVDLVAIGSGTRKMFMPKQKLHTHEEVFKDHVSGQYDENFVSECRAAGFTRTLLSGLVRSIRTM